jgi:hypothetical protein
MFTTMKKTYINPELNVLFVHTENIMTLSTQSGYANKDGEVLVKEQQPVTPSYNVWDDDWSE